MGWTSIDGYNSQDSSSRLHCCCSWIHPFREWKMGASKQGSPCLERLLRVPKNRDESPGATTLLLHKGRRTTTFAPPRVRRDDCRLQRFFCRGGPLVTVVFFSWTSVFRFFFFFFFFGAFPCPRIFCGVWEFSPLSDTNYLRLLAAAAANAMLTTVHGGEQL